MLHLDWFNSPVRSPGGREVVQPRAAHHLLLLYGREAAGQAEAGVGVEAGHRAVESSVGTAVVGLGQAGVQTSQVRTSETSHQTVEVHPSSRYQVGASWAASNTKTSLARPAAQSGQSLAFDQFSYQSESQMLNNYNSGQSCSHRVGKT